MSYQAPLRDIRFVLWNVLDFASHYAALGDDQTGRDLVDAVLDEAARFAEEVLSPLNAVGDREGCVLENGVVRAPTGFGAAYSQYIAGGWPAMVGAAEFGGQGLPPTLAMAVEEMVSAANIAWGMYPGLSRGAAGALEAHGSAEQKQQYLLPLLRGDWTGTMCLTEPHAGSDVGLLRTRAEPLADGSYAITGTKIFISAGEHDLAENIVHLVLARLPNAPKGTRGISLFIVPKFLPKPDGSIGARNGLQCSALEDKMGIHGNATCVMNFDGAKGFLIGPENGGMRCMFTMMNSARLVVGIQGLGQMENGFQQALRYAQERKQMRALTAPQTATEADPILVHPDVRRMLLTQKALVEGCRLLIYEAGKMEDIVRRGGAGEQRDKAQRWIDFLTPVAKGFVTEIAFECVNHTVQTYGGHGFIRDNGVEQLVRDTRITLIYEGTTQIQALDLLGRKIAQNMGQTLREVIAELTLRANLCVAYEELRPMAERALDAYQRWGEVAQAVLGKAMQDPNEMGAAAVDFLMFSGYTLLADGWLQQARAAMALPTEDEFARGKLEAARFYFDRLLPRTLHHEACMRSGAGNLMTPTAETLRH